MKIIYLLLLVSFIAAPLLASPSPADSLKEYELGTIISVSDKKQIRRIEPSLVNEIGMQQVRRSDAASITDLGRYIPASFIQTNSRGENLLYLRGAGERQLGLFLDGVLLNVPWDNRMDLSLVPADIIGKITVSKGANSVQYGANVLGGAVNISTFERSSPGFGITARLQGDDAGGWMRAFTADGRSGKLNYIASFEYLKSDGFLMSGDDADDDNMQHQSLESKLRTNTDIDRISTYIRGEYKFSDNLVSGLSWNFFQATKGVAPLTREEDDNVRYWRMPDNKRSLVTLNGYYKSDDEKYITKWTLWHDSYYLNIDSYSDISYSEIIERERDDDQTLGLRLTQQLPISNGQTLTVVMNFMNSDHNEKKSEPGEVGSDLDFSQRLISPGLEYTLSWGSLSAKAGVCYDISTTPKTGLFTESEGESNSDWGAFGGVRYDLNNAHSVFVNLSRRTRFPTLRESYSGALGKFKVNPDLGAETGTMSELGYEYNSRIFSATASLFTSLYSDLIVKEKDKSDSLGRKMRINLQEATIAGVECSFRYTPTWPLFAEGHVTYLFAEGSKKGTDETTELEYRPEYSAMIVSGYKFDYGLTPAIEIFAMGRQWGEDALLGDLVEIDPSVIINLRLGYSFMLDSACMTELFIRCSNLLDASITDKVGLPAPGRMFKAGMTIRL